MSEHYIWRLEESEPELLASILFRPDAVVSVMSIACNWGPPVSGRFDTDYLDIWAVADESVKAASVVLYGRGEISDWSSPWRDIAEFTKAKTANVDGDWGSRTVGVYHFAGLPVEEFVVRLTDDQGRQYFDNNGGYGVNYRLDRWVGLQTNCVRAGSTQPPQFSTQIANCIVAFPRLINLRGRADVAKASIEQ
jgi:hypothetical protein